MAGISLQFYLNDGSDTFRDYSSGNASFPTIDYFGWSREGYNFLYWNFASDGSGTTYYADAPIPESLRGGSEPFYAIWEAVSPSVTYYKTSSTDLTSVADAIRAKRGTSASLVYPNGFVSAIEDISFDGAVRFLDYDGTVLYSYSASEFANLTEMPTNPTHTGLTAQGWNWTLANAKTYVATYGMLDIGQMYITDDGKTRIYISLVDSVALSPYLGICPNGTVVVDWGDNTTTNTLTGTSLTTVKRAQHTYASTGDYIITLTATSGSFAIYGASYGSYLFTRTTDDTDSQHYYQNAIRKVELGSNVSIGNYAFYLCYSLASITIPSSVTSIGTYAFYSCCSLESIIIPNGVTSIGTNVFYGCYSITRIIIPNSVTSISQHAFQNCCRLVGIALPSGVTFIGEYAFDSCYSITRITIPNSVTSINNYAFRYCYSLASITLPSGLTSIGTYAFQYCSSLADISIPDRVTSIGDNAFYYCRSIKSITIPSGITSILDSLFSQCYSLKSITIPSSVTSIYSSAFSNCYSLASITLPSGLTSIGNYMCGSCYSLASITIPNGVTSIGTNAFSNCYSVSEYHFLPTTPPTLANTNAFNGIRSDCKIYVPAASLSAYQTATNWSTYASYMVGE